MAARQIRTSPAAENDTNAITQTFSLADIRAASSGLHYGKVDRGIVGWMDADTFKLQGRTARSTKSPQVTFRLTADEMAQAVALIRQGIKLSNQEIAARYAPVAAEVEEVTAPASDVQCAGCGQMFTADEITVDGYCDACQDGTCDCCYSNPCCCQYVIDQGAGDDPAPRVQPATEDGREHLANMTLVELQAAYRTLSDTWPASPRTRAKFDSWMTERAVLSAAIDARMQTQDTSPVLLERQTLNGSERDWHGQQVLTRYNVTLDGACVAQIERTVFGIQTWSLYDNTTSVTCFYTLQEALAEARQRHADGKYAPAQPAVDDWACDTCCPCGAEKSPDSPLCLECVIRAERYVCHCGNTTCSSGFYPCDGAGVEMEPTRQWPGYYACGWCGSISA